MPRGRKPKNQTVNTVNDIETEESKEVSKFPGETALNHLRGADTCLFYAGEAWSFNLAKEMLREHPDEVRVVFEDKVDTSIEIEIPFKCMQYIKWPTKRNMTDEQREAAKERMKKAQAARKTKKENN